MNDEKRLPEKKVLAFAFSMFGASIFFSLVNSYFNFYATDIAGVPTGLLGTANFIIKLVMVVSVVVFSTLVQNGKSKRFGKYRKWIVVATPVFTITTILTFTKVEGSGLFMALYYCIMYALASGFHGLAGNAQLALMREMGKTDEDQRRLSTRRSLFQDISKILFSASFVPLLLMIGGSETSAKGYFGMAVIIAVIAFLGYAALYKESKEYDIYDEEVVAEKTKMTAGEIVNTIFKNPPLMILLVLETVKFTAYMVFISTFVYYFQYILFDFTSITLTTTVASVASVVASAIAPWIIKQIGRKTSGIVSLAFYAAGALIPRFLAPNLTIFIIGFCMIYFGMSLQTCAGVLMFSDSAAYYENKSGKNATGFIMGLYTFPVQLGLALSAGIVNWSLSGIGYVPGAELSAAQTVGMQNIILLVPGIMFLVSMVLSMIYPLSEKRMKEIEAELKEKRAKG